jgi:hypothetical protein
MSWMSRIEPAIFFIKRVKLILPELISYDTIPCFFEQVGCRMRGHRNALMLDHCGAFQLLGRSGSLTAVTTAEQRRESETTRAA